MGWIKWCDVTGKRRRRKRSVEGESMKKKNGGNDQEEREEIIQELINCVVLFCVYFPVFDLM